MADRVPYRFVLRRGLAAEWTAQDGILLEGEFGLELDTGRLKLGDGVTAWNGLPYSDMFTIERAQDAAASMLVDGAHSGISFVYDDASGRVNATVTGGGDGAFPTASFDGGGDDIQVGAACDLFLPFGFTIQRATLLADAVGSLVIDVRVVPFASHPAGVGASICGSAKPSISGADQYQDDTLTGWTTAISGGSVMRFVVTACSGVKRANLVIEGVRT